MRGCYRQNRRPCTASNLSELSNFLGSLPRCLRYDTRTSRIISISVSLSTSMYIYIISIYPHPYLFIHFNINIYTIYIILFIFSITLYIYMYVPISTMIKFQVGPCHSPKNRVLEAPAAASYTLPRGTPKVARSEDEIGQPCPFGLGNTSAHIPKGHCQQEVSIRGIHQYQPTFQQPCSLPRVAMTR